MAMGVLGSIVKYLKKFSIQQIEGVKKKTFIKRTCQIPINNSILWLLKYYSDNSSYYLNIIFESHVVNKLSPEKL